MSQSISSRHLWRRQSRVIGSVALVLASSVPVLASTAPEVAVASTCATNGYRISARTGVSCTTAKRVLRNYVNRSSTKGWSCSRSRKECNGSGLSIDEYRYFRFR